MQELNLKKERHDPFYFSRSDLSDAEKLAILDSKLKQGLEDIKAGRVVPAEQVRRNISAKLAPLMKKAS